MCNVRGRKETGTSVFAFMVSRNENTKLKISNQQRNNETKTNKQYLKYKNDFDEFNYLNTVSVIIT